MYWIHLAQDGEQRWKFVNVVISFHNNQCNTLYRIEGVKEGFQRPSLSCPLMMTLHCHQESLETTSV
jgi:hypothetical protein